MREVDPPHALVFKDGTRTEDGSPDDEMPTTATTITIADAGVGLTHMSLTSDALDEAAMDALLEMQADVGLSSAMGQIDASLEADSASWRARGISRRRAA